MGIHGSNVIATSNVRPLQMAADSAQDVLAQQIWTANQSYYLSIPDKQTMDEEELKATQKRDKEINYRLRKNK